MRKRKLKTAAHLKKERGVWVIDTEGKLPESIVNRVIRQVREERYKLLMGQEPNKRADLKLEA